MQIRKRFIFGAIVSALVFIFLLLDVGSDRLAVRNPVQMPTEENRPLYQESTQNTYFTEAPAEAPVSQAAGHSGQKTNLPNREELPFHLNLIINEFSAPGVFVKIKQDDLDVLLDFYKSHPTFTLNKIWVTWALGLIGGKEVEDLFIGHLQETILHEEEAPGSGISSLLCTMGALGVMAASSDRCYNYLLSLTEKDGWRDAKGNYLGGMEGRALAYLGAVADRPEIDELMQYWVDNIDKPNAPSPADIVDAHFHKFLVKEHGLAGYVDILGFPDSSKTAYAFWTRTEEGRKWKKWQQLQWDKGKGSDR